MRLGPSAVAALTLVAALGPAGAAAAHGHHHGGWHHGARWSQAQCDAAFSDWAMTHPRATPRQHDAELRHLSRGHGCRFPR